LETHLPECEECEESRRTLLAAADGLLGVGVLLPAALPEAGTTAAAPAGPPSRGLRSVRTTVASAATAAIAAVVVGLALSAEDPSRDPARRSDPINPVATTPLDSPSSTSRPMAGQPGPTAPSLEPADIPP